MTITALRPDGTVIDGRLYDDPRRIPDFDQLRHPIARDQKVLPVRGYSRHDRNTRTVSHFRLQQPARTIPWPADVEFDGEYGRDGHLYPESTWHINGKAFIAAMIEAEVADTPDAQVLLEHRVEITPGRHRIADVALLIGGIVREVYEVQLAIITVDEINARTDDWSSVGAACYWVIGRDAADQSSIRGHLRDFHGGVFELLAAADEDIREPSRTQPARVSPARSKGKGQAA